MRIRALRPDDWPVVEAIYAAGIATGCATFESVPPSWPSFDDSRHRYLRLVAVENDRVVGWAAASPVSSRAVYAGVVEHSVYVDPVAGGRGIGRLLLESLAQLGEATGVWTIQSAIFPENVASIALHRSCGFVVVGRRRAVGRHEGRWRDVLFIERRSETVGVHGPMIRLITSADLDPAVELLKRSGLPADDLDRSWRTWVADDYGQIVGIASVQRHGDEVPAYLLKHLAVAEPARGSGLAAQLVRAARTTADLQDGYPAMLTLSETAAGVRLEAGPEGTSGRPCQGGP